MISKRKYYYSLIIAILSISACNIKSIPPRTVYSEVSIQSSIGGEIVLADDARLIIPPDSISQNTDVTLMHYLEKPDKVSDFPKGTMPLSDYYDINIGDANLMSLVFLELPYDANKVPTNIPVDQIKNHMFMGIPNGDTWIRVYGNINSSAHTLTVMLDELYDPLVMWEFGDIADSLYLRNINLIPNSLSVQAGTYNHNIKINGSVQISFDFVMGNTQYITGLRNSKLCGSLVQWKDKSSYRVRITPLLFYFDKVDGHERMVRAISDDVIFPIEIEETNVSFDFEYAFKNVDEFWNDNLDNIQLGFSFEIEGIDSYELNDELHCLYITLVTDSARIPVNLIKQEVDSDHDGYNDFADSCPSQGNNGYGIDSKGCPIPPASDKDNDGFKDSEDLCPNQGNEGYGLDTKGCPLPPPDSDNDGLVDSKDSCPNQGNKGYGVDAKGCPLSPPTDPNEYYPIPGCAASRIHMGDTVTLAVGVDNVHVRSTPDTHPADNIIGSIHTGDIFQIISGPVCNWDWLLWEIRTANGLVGWAPETDGNEFWFTHVDNTPMNPTPANPTPKKIDTPTLTPSPLCEWLPKIIGKWAVPQAPGHGLYSLEFKRDGSLLGRISYAPDSPSWQGEYQGEYSCLDNGNIKIISTVGKIVAHVEFATSPVINREVLKLFVEQDTMTDRKTTSYEFWPF